METKTEDMGVLCQWWGKQHLLINRLYFLIYRYNKKSETINFYGPIGELWCMDNWIEYARKLQDKDRLK